jgi:hypothetical protein
MSGSSLFLVDADFWVRFPFDFPLTSAKLVAAALFWSASRGMCEVSLSWSPAREHSGCVSSFRFRWLGGVKKLP